MDALGNIQPVAVKALPVPAAPVLSKPVVVAEVPVFVGTPDKVEFTPQLADQKRFEAIKRMAQQVANVFIVNDRRFTIFKDASGQFITRFTSLRDGKVTYIPEPDLIKISGSVMPNVVNIDV